MDRGPRGCGFDRPAPRLSFPCADSPCILDHIRRVFDGSVVTTGNDLHRGRRNGERLEPHRLERLCIRVLSLMRSRRSAAPTFPSTVGGVLRGFLVFGHNASAPESATIVPLSSGRDEPPPRPGDLPRRKAGRGAGRDEPYLPLVERSLPHAQRRGTARRALVNAASLPSSVQTELGPGSRLGPYVITRRLSAGGMSTVYLAEHPVLGRPAALKVLWPRGLSLERLRRHWLEESRILARIQHPRVVTIYDADIDPKLGVFWIAEQYVGDVVLRHLLRECQPLGIGHALQLMVEITEGVRAGHLASAIHRDLKPDNIAITDNGACVFDFGVAKTLNDVTSQDTRHIVGTAGYMAREQFERGSVTPATDVFALGLMLAEMVLGTHPLSRTWGKLDLLGPSEIYGLYRGDFRERLHTLLVERNVPLPVAQVIEHAAQPEPLARHPDTDALLADLTSLELEYRPRTSRPPPRLSQPPNSPRPAPMLESLPTVALPLVIPRTEPEPEPEPEPSANNERGRLTRRIALLLGGSLVVVATMLLTLRLLGAHDPAPPGPGAPVRPAASHSPGRPRQTSAAPLPTFSATPTAAPSASLRRPQSHPHRPTSGTSTVRRELWMGEY